MSVLKNNFSYGINQCSPVEDDYNRVVKHDEKGTEYIVYEKVDYPAVQKSYGTADDWQLENLLKAGISPDFNIHTGFNTRLEGVDVLGDLVSFAEGLAAEENNEEKK